MSFGSLLNKIKKSLRELFRRIEISPRSKISQKSFLIGGFRNSYPLKQEFSLYYLLLFFLLAGVVYRGGLSDTTLLLSVVITRGFVFFSSRYFAALACIYLIAIIYVSAQGDHSGAETQVLYFFWYLLFAYLVAFLEYRKDEEEK